MCKQKGTLAVAACQICFSPPPFLTFLCHRYDKQARQLKLVSNRFPNRIENKRYLVYLLENLLAEARRAEGGAS